MHSAALTVPDVVIVGGGLAGMAAAVQLAAAGRRVTLLESRARLGGRASSFLDHETGELIDNCQHVAMGCCTQFLEFCRTTGIASQFRHEKLLTFLAPGAAPYQFKATGLPAPFHLAWAFIRLPYLTGSEKWRFAQGVRTLWSTPSELLKGKSLLEWLRQHHQPERVIRRGWEVLLMSALSESLDRIDASYARKVLVDGFLTTHDGWELYIPNVSLDELFTQQVLPWLQTKGVDVRLGTAIEHVAADGHGVQHLTLKSGAIVSAKHYLLTVPWHRLGALLGASLLNQLVLPDFNLIESAPITSVHLWTDQPLMAQQHMVLVDRLCQWLFVHPASARQGAGFRYQVVISASRLLKNWDRTETIQRVWAELREIFPAAATATLQHARVVTEHRAVFSPLPGIDKLRPPQQTNMANLHLAGDWTQTGWPATLEGAVRSGNLAAANILRAGQ